MKVSALIMAGGKGRRFGLGVEKPLALFMGKPFLEWVVIAVKSASKISDFYVATSLNTPKTEEKCLREGLRVIRTDGKGYHQDLRQAIVKGELYHTVITVSSDLPALTGSFLDKIISIYGFCGKPALTVLVPIERCKEVGISTPSLYKYKGVAYAVSGVNVLDGAKIFEKEMDEEIIILEDIEAVVNINSYEDLKNAEKYMLSIDKCRKFQRT